MANVGAVAPGDGSGAGSRPVSGPDAEPSAEPSTQPEPEPGKPEPGTEPEPEKPGPGTELTVGWLLRHWRTHVARRSASGVAAELGTVRAAVANWEAGRRVPDADRIHQIDRIYGAGGALAGLCRAVGTPSALDADSMWWHHFDHGRAPCWAWVRVPDGHPSVMVGARWGPLRVDVRLPGGPEGAIITLPTSTADPPVCVSVDPPGWVEFGTGPIPPSLPIPSRSVVRHIRPVLPPDPALTLIAGRLRPLMSANAGWVDQLRGALGVGRHLVDATLVSTGASVADLTMHDPSPPLPGASHWSGRRYQDLRHARNMSRQLVADSVTDLWPAEPLLDGQLETFEAGGKPRVDDLAGRLDVVYRADGRSFVAPSGIAREGEGVLLRPPVWWHGPLWVQPYRTDGEGGAGVVRIRWDPWEKAVRLRPGTVVSFRKRSGDLSRPTVLLPEGWAVRSGIGLHPGAVPVDHDWAPIDDERARPIFSRYVEVYLELFGRSARDVRAILDPGSGPDS